MTLASRFSAKFLIALLCSTFAAQAQLVFTNGVHKFASLGGVTATLSGKTELWLTNSAVPLSGCVIDLTSPDSWLFLTGVKPSATVATYLNQVRVNGAVAIADNNVRVVQYGQSGAVIIPHSSTFQPLQAFTGPNFTGSSAQFSQYVYYTGNGLGALDMNISSFRLKRGYMAVFAQNTSGTGFSKSYVAQDGDLEIGALPPNLDKKVRFIYITPWRWVSKKGIAGNIEGPLNVLWKYNWNLDQNSTRDIEYVAIRQNQWWPGLDQNWKVRGINTVLGYNEPDGSDQANMSVNTAISAWPDLLATGLRVGSPAVTDGGRNSWLYPFMQQADAAGLRVDFVAVHYYWCFDPSNPSGAANQMYNFLKATYDQVKRPLWVTEWNNGANWTGCADPTYAQQQACIAAMIDMLENTPFVERYALYNWVEDVRRLSWDNGSLTEAGVTYRDKVSNLSYTQAMPDNGTRSVAQYFFDQNALDSSGFGNNALTASAPAYTNGVRGEALVLDGANNYVQLPANIASSNAFSFAAWVNWNGGGNWQRLFDFGNDTTQYLFLTPSASSGRLRFAIRNGGGEQILEAGSPLPANEWQHVCFTLSGGMGRLYTNGVLAASGSISITPANFKPAFNYIGKSQFIADPLFNGAIDDVQIADYALTPAQVAALMTNTPPTFSADLIDLGEAVPFAPFTTNISAYATDLNPSDTLTFTKASGPAWINISPAGLLSGTPGANNGGMNHITVRVSDAAGANAYATFAVYVPITYGSGTWIVDADGFWDESTNWNGGAIPNGGNGINHTADFSTINITADRTVRLENARSIGTLRFGDISGAQNWNLTSDGPALTLDAGLSSPSIQVNQNTATLALPVDGANGFTKSGAGTLVLAGSNPLKGTVFIDTSLTSGSSGNTRIAHPNALSSVTNISIRNNNSGTSTLQFDGSQGDVITPASISLSGRTINSAAIQNLSGSNSINGGISLGSGGSFYVLQSDSGTLNLGGMLSAGSSATGTRTFTFQGAGNFHVSGPLVNGSATNNLTKSGPGNLTLAAANTHSGTNRISGGMLTLAHSGALQNSTLDMNAADSGILRFSGITAASLGGLTGTRPITLANLSNAPVTLSFGGSGLNQTYSGVFTGPGSIIKTGSGTATLAALNTFTGTTRVNGGVLALGNGFTLQNSTLDLNGSDSGRISFGNYATANLGGLMGSGNLWLTNGIGAPLTLNVGGNGQDTAFAGVLAGSGHLHKTGLGQLVLSGANTYSGNTIISGGTLALSRDPIVKFTFDSVGGGIVTNTGTGGSALNGTIVNSSTGVSFVPGRVGNALNVSGDGSFVAISNRVTSTDGNTPGANWTLALWIRTAQTGAGYAYQGDGGWGSGNTAFYLNQGNTSSGTRVGAVRWGGGWLTGNASVNNGQWRHIAIANNNGIKSIYVDGNLDATVNTWNNPGTGNQFWIGGTANNGDGVAKLNGQLDEVAIYNRALSIVELRSLTNAIPGATPGNFGGQLPTATALMISESGTFDLGGNSQAIASLSDYSGTGGLMTNSGAAPATLTINGNAGSTTFSGTIADAALTNAITLLKSGASTTILSGTNTHRGSTLVNAGTLLIEGRLSESPVSVAGTGRLGGNGTIDGTVTVQSGATLAPGTSIGHLTINNDVTLEPGSVLELEISAADLTNDVLSVAGTLTGNGTLLVSNTGGTLSGGMKFKLLEAAVINGSFASLVLPPLEGGMDWNFSLETGELSVIATNAPALATAFSENSLTLSWPAGHLGWRLQVQTNSLGAGLGNNWVDVPNSAFTNQMTLPVDPENGAVFYRLVYP